MFIAKIFSHNFYLFIFLYTMNVLFIIATFFFCLVCYYFSVLNSLIHVSVKKKTLVTVCLNNLMDQNIYLFNLKFLKFNIKNQHYNVKIKKLSPFFTLNILQEKFCGHLILYDLITI